MTSLQSTGIIIVPGTSGYTSSFIQNLQTQLSLLYSTKTISLWNTKEKLNSLSIQNIFDEITIQGESLRKEGCQTIILIGKSLGGFICAQYKNECINKLILLGPAFVPIQNEVSYQSATTMNHFNSLEDLQISFQTLQDISIPVLLIHGREDTVVPLHLAQKISENISSCQFTVIEKAGHSFKTQEQLSEIIDVIRKFHLKIFPERF